MSEDEKGNRREIKTDIRQKWDGEGMTHRRMILKSKEGYKKMLE